MRVQGGNEEGFNGHSLVTSPDESKLRSNFLVISHRVTIRDTASAIARWQVCPVSAALGGGISLASSLLLASDRSGLGLVSRGPLRDPVSLSAAATSLVLVSRWSCVGADPDCSVLRRQSRSLPPPPSRGCPLRSLQS